MRRISVREVIALCIWSLADPMESQYASFTAYAPSWRQDGHCSECKRSIPAAVRKRPLHLSWDEGSECVADFTWGPGSGAILVTKHVLKALLTHFSGFEGASVEMIQDPKLKRPSRPNRRSKRRVWLPYEGPPVQELWITTRVPSDLQRSSLQLTIHCPACGFRFYQILGGERAETKWDRTIMRSEYTRVPRVPGQGLFVREKDLAGADLFKAIERDDHTLCTDRAKDFITEQGFTNVEFFEIGELVG
jgi:hypothetical protein